MSGQDDLVDFEQRADARIGPEWLGAVGPVAAPGIARILVVGQSDVRSRLTGVEVGGPPIGRGVDRPPGVLLADLS